MRGQARQPAAALGGAALERHAFGPAPLVLRVLEARRRLPRPSLVGDVPRRTELEDRVLKVPHAPEPMLEKAQVPGRQGTRVGGARTHTHAGEMVRGVSGQPHAEAWGDVAMFEAPRVTTLRS